MLRFFGPKKAEKRRILSQRHRRDWEISMTFISIKHLREGMVLDRDVYMFDSKTSKVAMLRAGGVLTKAYIDKLSDMGILGVYIQSHQDEIPQSRDFATVKPDMKKEAISRIKTAYSLFNNTTFNNVHVDSIKETSDIARQLVDTLVNNKGIFVNVEDLRLYDDYTYNHSLGVAILSIAIGLSLSLKRTELYELALCALLHDIGKMGVPIEIISKPTRLTVEEYNIVKSHPMLGAQFAIRQNITNKAICSGILTHHERYDGMGYPHGLAGENIPLFGRIISVADVYDALTSARPYREPSAAPEAIEYIMGASGKAFDINVVSAFLRRVAPYPVGSCVRLSNGKMAIVVKQNDHNPLRPVVRLFERVKVPLDLYYQRDLQNIVIDEICTVQTDVII